MTTPGLRYQFYPFFEMQIGRGSYSTVYKATEEGSGRLVAVKKSRASKTQKRPILRHESRVLQMLQGHAAFPVIYGYDRLEHFEYIAMEFLGPSIADKREEGGAAVPVPTVIRVVDQVLGALQHIHSFGLVHRDIKPDNLLCALNDESRIKVIDFGLAKPFSRGQPGKPYNPLMENRAIVGTLTWASLNSHDGIDLSPRDDIESLAFTALFLLRGHLPWKSRPREEDELRSQEIVRLMKLASPGPALSVGFPAEFGELLTYSRCLSFGQLPDYGMIRRWFTGLAARMGCSGNNGPLDWTACHPKTTNPIVNEPEVFIPSHDGDGWV